MWTFDVQYYVLVVCTHSIIHTGFSVETSSIVSSTVFTKIGVVECAMFPVTH